MYRLNRAVVVVVFALFVTGILPLAAFAESESQSSSIEQTFQKAKQDYLQKDMDSAAGQIKKGADYMKAESLKASAKGKEALTSSARELEQLSVDVKKGTVKSVKKIEQSFARAYLAMAADRHIKSAESWSRKESEKTGEALDSSSRYLERSFAWAGQKVETHTKKAIEKSKSLSLKLKEKGNVIAKDVEKGLKDTGSEIEKLGKRISPK
ncbi:MAG: hypothetical protein WAU61_11265 [Smithella sp.]